MREKNYKNNTHTQPCSFEKLQLCSVPFVYKETPCKVSFVQKNKLSLLKKCYVHRWDNCISLGFFFSLSLSKQNVTKNSLPRQRKIPEMSMIMNVLNGVWCWNVLVFFFVHIIVRFTESISVKVFKRNLPRNYSTKKKTHYFDMADSSLTWVKLWGIQMYVQNKSDKYDPSRETAWGNDQPCQHSGDIFRVKNIIRFISSKITHVGMALFRKFPQLRFLNHIESHVSVVRV